MKLTKKDLVEAEIKRAEEALTMSGLAIEAGLWNSCASELYYTCFYLVQAMFIVADIEARTHAGIKSLFSLRFIKENRIDEKYGRLFSNYLPIVRREITGTTS